jgi:precorrin-2 dehydrogenase/sirohydrochlorin ferrochelatase
MVVMIPLMIDFSGRSVVIFGGGEVGARKAVFFSRDADVTVISRSFVPVFAQLPVGQVAKDISGMSEGELKDAISGAFLVVAATPDAGINNRIGDLCRRHGILFNNARGEEGTVVVPSVERGEHFLLAISTEGVSPAVSRYIRELIELACPDLDLMIALQARLRAALKDQVPDQEMRSRILGDVLHDREVWNLLARDPETAWRMVAERYRCE